MADNTTLSAGDGLGDTYRSEDKGGVKTPVSLIDIGGTGAESLWDGTVTANLGATDNAVLDAIAASLSGTLTVGSHAVTNAGTFAVQAAQSGTWNIGTVTAVTAISNALPAGTNAIGKLAANSGVDIGDVDILSIAAGDNNIGNVDIASIAAGDNNIGNVDVLTVPSSIQGPGNPVVDSYTSAAVSASANTANQSLVAAPGANKQIWVYGLILTADTGDGSFSIQDEDDTAKSGVMAISQNGGFVINPSGNFSMPWFKVATNKALEIDTVTCGAKGIISYAVVDVS